jgi:Chromate resistance exported protein
MTWITREKSKVDRVAGPWLIRNVVYDAPYGECKRRITKSAEPASSVETKGISMFEILSKVR